MKNHVACLAICVAFLLGACSEGVFGQTTVPQAAPKQAATVPKTVTKTPVPVGVNLTDPEGEIIGYKDPKTGDLLFPNINVRIPHTRIVQVSKEKFLAMKQGRGLNKPTLKYAKKPGVAQTATPYGSTRVIVDGIDMTGMRIPGGAIGGSGSNASSRNCVTMCWHFQEGQIYCQGCAIDEGNGICTVWEYCSDFQESGPLK
jgi:hypothetical protein